MWGIYSYLISIMIFAGLPIVIEIIFGFHLFKKHLKTVGFITLICLLGTPIGERMAFLMKTWIYNPHTSFYQKILGSELETYIFSLFVGIAISTAVAVWTFYEDERKNILMQTIKDILEGTYAVWRKKK